MSFKDCVIETERCLEDIPTIEIQHNTEITILHTIVDKAGEPIDLTPYTESPTEPNTVTGVRLIIKDLYSKSLADFHSHLVVNDATNGVVELAFQPDSIERPGMYLMVIDLIINDKPQQFFTYYIMVDPGLEFSNPGPITPAEIRIALRDSCPEANYLLDEVEFTDQEVFWAIRRPVDYWNSALPPLPQVSPNNFPYRYQWLDATIGELMVMAGRHYLRNKLDYAAGGVSVDDKNKDAPYLTIGNQMITEWKEYVRRVKVGQNMNRAIGSIGSVIGNNFYRGSYSG